MVNLCTYEHDGGLLCLNIFCIFFHRAHMHFRDTLYSSVFDEKKLRQNILEIAL